MLKILLVWIFRALVISFVVMYPMMVSIYVELPLFIGYAGYIFILGLEGRGARYIVLALLYLVNLEINLSLPILVILLAVLVFYQFFYHKLDMLKRCEVCIAVITVAAVDLIYLILIVGYDFIFETNSITINSLLYFSLIMDILVAVLI